MILALKRRSRSLSLTRYSVADERHRLFAFTIGRRNSSKSQPNPASPQDGFTPMSVKESTERAGPSIARPSSSVLLIAPNNHILLLQRVKKSSSFASAHVFPGGNISSYHDGQVPAEDSPERHVDTDVYRMAAIRETFEESGILLARNNGFGRLIEVSEAEREEGRKLVHGDKMPFQQWLARKGGRADIQSLIPFTRWVTPTNVPKRFTTQMYLYFLPTFATKPFGSSAKSAGSAFEDAEPEISIPVPTTDGGLEHTHARFLPASAWLRLAQEGRVILFPPQFFLLHQVAQFLDNLPAPTAYARVSRDVPSIEQLQERRGRLVEFVRSGDPPWTQKCISPIVIPRRDGSSRDDGRAILGLNRPGHELTKAGSTRKGVADQVVLVKFSRDGPRQLAVVSKQEALEDSSAKL